MAARPISSDLTMTDLAAVGTMNAGASSARRPAIPPPGGGGPMRAVLPDTMANLATVEDESEAGSHQLGLA